MHFLTEQLKPYPLKFYLYTSFFQPLLRLEWRECLDGRLAIAYVIRFEANFEREEIRFISTRT